MNAYSLTAVLFTIADSEMLWLRVRELLLRLSSALHIRGSLPAAAPSYSTRPAAGDLRPSRANMPISSPVYLSLSLCFINVVVALPFMSVGLKQSKWISYNTVWLRSLMDFFKLMCIMYIYYNLFFKLTKSSHMNSQHCIEGFLYSFNTFITGSKFYHYLW